MGLTPDTPGADEAIAATPRPSPDNFSGMAIAGPDLIAGGDLVFPAKEGNMDWIAAEWLCNGRANMGYATPRSEE